MSWVQIRKLFARKIVTIFLPINLNMCFGCSKELSHRTETNNFQLRILIWMPELCRLANFCWLHIPNIDVGED